MKTISSLAIHTILLVACAFPAFAAPAAKPVKIGLMAPLTGAFASEGQDMQKIVELMVEETNRTGGIDGNPVELLVEDDGSSPRAAATAASRLVAKGAIAAIGTYGSAVTEASQDIYDEAGVVQIATGSTSIRLTSKGLKRFFRTCPRDDEQGRVAVAVLEKFAYKRIAILHDNSAYAKGLAEEAKKLLDANKNVQIIFYDALVPGERDYSVIITKIKGLQPDALLFTGYYPEAGMLLRQMKEMKWSLPIFGGDATNNRDLVKIAGAEAASGFMFISPPPPEDIQGAAAENFLNAYRAKHQEYPGSVWSVLAGDAYLTLCEAVRQSGVDPAAIAEFLHKDLKDFAGLTGKISFDNQGDRLGDLYGLYKVAPDGTFTLVPERP